MHPNCPVQSQAANFSRPVCRFHDVSNNRGPVPQTVSSKDCLETCAGPFQRKIRPDHLDDVVSGRDLLYGLWWNHAGYLFFARLLSEAMPNLLSAGALSKQ